MAAPSAEIVSPLFATSLVASSPKPSPLIVVGLPRSGSSFLSYAISQIDDWYVFDDLYLLRAAMAQGVKGPLTNEQLEKLVEFLAWQLKARIKWVTFAGPNCTWADVDRMSEAVLTAFAGQSPHWNDLLEEWMTRLARHHGCSHWGYKAPQDFMHLDLLRQLWPEAGFIFIYRDPRRVMASKKYVNDQDGDPRQYHPAVYSRYWRMSVESMTQAAISANVQFVRFEDLIADPNEEARKIAQFLGTTFEGDVRRSDANTSFAAGKRKSITPTEEWICEQIAGEAMLSHGYTLRRSRPRLRDLPDLLWVSCRFTIYQTLRIARDGRARQSVISFLKMLFRPR
jgi:hypothetical protein